ncbi:MAG: DNA mismatch repair protein MutS, partial [Bradyrhizobium sp.]|nr:DNA mismatch repair protein MutS [Bradyrhizobium sp.]
MKRPPSTPIPELSAPPRRRRSLSEEERALWESVAKQTKPLRKRARAAKAHAASADPVTPAAAGPANPPKQHPPARPAR